MCSQKNRRMIKICVSYLVYSQIWLNLSKDNCHLFLRLPIDDCQQKNPRKYTSQMHSHIYLFIFYKCSYPLGTFKVSQIRGRGQKKKKKKKRALIVVRPF